MVSQLNKLYTTDWENDYERWTGKYV